MSKESIMEYDFNCTKSNGSGSIALLFGANEKYLSLTLMLFLPAFFLFVQNIKTGFESQR